jgi:hypothetical protein
MMRIMPPQKLLCAEAARLIPRNADLSGAMTQTYSTRETARMVNIMVTTLLRWVKTGKVKPSVVVPLGSEGREMWRWTEADIAKVKRYKKANYQKGVGRPRTSKVNH